MKQCPGKYCQSRMTPSRSRCFIVYSLSTLICTWDDMYAIGVLPSLVIARSLSRPPSLPLPLHLSLLPPPSTPSLSVAPSLPLHYIVYPLIFKSDNTPTHTVVCSRSHTHTCTQMPPPLGILHLFQHILSILCLFLTSLYSQLSIASIPANYLRCLTHYFPIFTANLPPPTHARTQL